MPVAGRIAILEKDLEALRLGSRPVEGDAREGRQLFRAGDIITCSR